MLYIGIDLGTSAVKLLLMEENGRIKKIVSKEYPLSFPKPGWSEQEPKEWYERTMEGLKELFRDSDGQRLAGGEELERLMDVITVFRDSPYRNRIMIDFSLVSDVNYYNGIVFRGFLPGIPDSVLSGGQYDKLMHRLGRRSGAVGFAVYLDQLQEVLR